MGRTIKEIWNRKIKLSRFWTGLGMQIFQASLITFWVFTTLNWSWFKMQYVAVLVGSVVFLGYNIMSWRLLLQGLKEE